MLNLGDIQSIDGTSCPTVDVIIGGSPYKLKYRVLSQGISAGLVDEVFDEYERALDRAQALISDNKYVSIDLLLIGPSCVIGSTGNNILYKREIFTAVKGGVK